MWGSTIGGIVTLILSLLTAPLTSNTQQAANVPRLGLLIPDSSSAFPPRLEAFRHGLRDLGYVEGHNIRVEYQFAEGQYERLPALAAELVRFPVDVLVTAGAGVLAAKQATATIPIVFAVRELFETQLEGPTDLGRIPAGPGTFDQGTPGMGMPSLVNTALLTPRPTGICRRRQPQIIPKLSRVVETRQVAQFCHDGHGDGAT